MRYLFMFLTVAALSCNSSNKTDVGDLAKAYMKDSIVPRFNDPASYEFVSIKIDTFKGADYLNNLKRLYADTTFMSKETIQEKQKEITDLSSIPGYGDSILNLQIEISYRGKNKMGALVLDKTNLRYYPKENRFLEIQ